MGTSVQSVNGVLLCLQCGPIFCAQVGKFCHGQSYSSIFEYRYKVCFLSLSFNLIGGTRGNGTSGDFLERR